MIIRIKNFEAHKFERAIKVIIALFLALFLFSCGTVNKLKHKTEVKTDSLAVTKSVTSTTITERADTSFKIKADSITNQISQIQLDNGDTNKIETNDFKIETFKDKKTNTIHQKFVAKPKEVTLKFDKKTVQNKKEDSKIEVKKDNKEKEVTVKREGFSLGWKGWIAVSFSLLFLLVLLYIRLRKKYPFLP